MAVNNQSIDQTDDMSHSSDEPDEHPGNHLDEEIGKVENSEENTVDEIIYPNFFDISFWGSILFIALLVITILATIGLGLTKLF